MLTPPFVLSEQDKARLELYAERYHWAYAGGLTSADLKRLQFARWRLGPSLAQRHSRREASR